MKGLERIELSLSWRAKLFYIAAALFFLIAGLWNASNEGNENSARHVDPNLCGVIDGLLVVAQGSRRRR